MACRPAPQGGICPFSLLPELTRKIADSRQGARDMVRDRGWVCTNLWKPRDSKELGSSELEYSNENHVCGSDSLRWLEHLYVQGSGEALSHASLMGAENSAVDNRPFGAHRAGR